MRFGLALVMAAVSLSMPTAPSCSLVSLQARGPLRSDFAPSRYDGNMSLSALDRFASKRRRARQTKRGKRS